jgi:hypothetical protein
MADGERSIAPAGALTDSEEAEDGYVEIRLEPLPVGRAARPLPGTTVSSARRARIDAYDIEPPAGSTIHAVLYAEVGRCELRVSAQNRTEIEQLIVATRKSVRHNQPRRPLEVILRVEHLLLPPRKEYVLDVDDLAGHDVFVWIVAKTARVSTTMFRVRSVGA